MRGVWGLALVLACEPFRPAIVEESLDAGMSSPIDGGTMKDENKADAHVLVEAGAPVGCDVFNRGTPIDGIYWGEVGGTNKPKINNGLSFDIQSSATSEPGYLLSTYRGRESMIVFSINFTLSGGNFDDFTGYFRLIDVNASPNADNAEFTAIEVKDVWQLDYHEFLSNGMTRPVRVTGPKVQHDHAYVLKFTELFDPIGYIRVELDGSTIFNVTKIATEGATQRDSWNMKLGLAPFGGSTPSQHVTFSQVCFE